MNNTIVRTFFILGFGIGLGSAASRALRIESVQATPQTIPAFNPSQSLAPLVESLSGAVVNITTSMAQTMNPMAPFGLNMETPVPSGQGSGFLISNDGYILTNYHVIDSADSLTVKLANDEEYTGSVIGFDDSIDVALIKIEADSPFPYIKLGNSDAVRVGDYALAIGNPFGLSHTVTMGIISAKERVIGAGPYDTTANRCSINPGSGGPLFNLQEVGINTAINPRAQGIGFSLPINKVTAILDDLKKMVDHLGTGWDSAYSLVKNKERSYEKCTQTPLRLRLDCKVVTLSPTLMASVLRILTPSFDWWVLIVQVIQSPSISSRSKTLIHHIGI